MNKQEILLVVVAAACCFALGYTDKILDLKSAEQQKQDDCHRVMKRFGEVPAPLTSYCYGVKPETKKGSDHGKTLCSLGDALSRLATRQ